MNIFKPQYYNRFTPYIVPSPIPGCEFPHVDLLQPEIVLSGKDLGSETLGMKPESKQQLDILKQMYNSKKRDQKIPDLVQLVLTGNQVRVRKSQPPYEDLYAFSVEKLALLKWSQRDREIVYFAVRTAPCADTYQCFFYQMLTSAEAERLFINLAARWMYRPECGNLTEIEKFWKSKMKK